jgi:hypothetical protein
MATPVKAIRQYCVSSRCEGGKKAVRLCPDNDCPLYLYRLGKNPRRKGIGNHNASFC